MELEGTYVKDDNTTAETPERYKLVTLTFGGFEVTVQLNEANELVGIVEIKADKEALKSRVSPRSSYDVDELYPEEETD